jgi:hypothetical protein
VTIYEKKSGFLSIMRKNPYQYKCYKSSESRAGTMGVIDYGKNFIFILRTS